MIHDIQAPDTSATWFPADAESNLKVDAFQSLRSMPLLIRNLAPEQSGLPLAEPAPQRRPQPRIFRSSRVSQAPHFICHSGVADDNALNRTLPAFLIPFSQRNVISSILPFPASNRSASSYPNPKFLAIATDRFITCKTSPHCPSFLPSPRHRRRRRSRHGPRGKDSQTPSVSPHAHRHTHATHKNPPAKQPAHNPPVLIEPPQNLIAQQNNLAHKILSQIRTGAKNFSAQTFKAPKWPMSPSYPQGCVTHFCFGTLLLMHEKGGYRDTHPLACLS